MAIRTSGYTWAGGDGIFPCTGFSILRFPTPATHALRFMIFLARLPKGSVVRLEEITASAGLPPARMSKIARLLVRKGLAASRRGPDGGYRIGKPAGRIRLYDIFVAAESAPTRHQDCVLECRPVTPETQCGLHDQIAAAERLILKVLKKTTLAAYLGLDGEKTFKV